MKANKLYSATPYGWGYDGTLLQLKKRLLLLLLQYCSDGEIVLKACSMRLKPLSIICDPIQASAISKVYWSYLEGQIASVTPIARKRTIMGLSFFYSGFELFKTIYCKPIY